jgi:hypothetical protein
VLLYMAAPLITINDLYSFDPNHIADPGNFADIKGSYVAANLRIPMRPLDAMMDRWSFRIRRHRS